MALKLKTKYICQNCGYSSPKWIGKCPDCESWNTFVEEIIDTNKINNAVRFLPSIPKTTATGIRRHEKPTG